ncbi:MAG: NSS family neurotransmitter:Na+ symporter [Gammaproteobacteria bacterium]|jgi:NSS family neurotransmitter:Na+ symporter
MAKNPTQVLFSSKWGFFFAAIGSAIGLGNIWRFPFIAGENGGGAFILLYLIFIVSFGIPAVIAMIVIGRRGRQSPVGSTKLLALADGHSAKWEFLGWITLAVAYLALTFFSVVAGWVLVYLFKSASGLFAGISPAESIQIFAEVKADVGGMMFWHGVFLLVTIFIVSRGVQAGIEKTVKFMMPALFVILLILVGYAAATAEFAQAARFMFSPDFSKIDKNVMLLALSQAFFSLSVGGGSIIAYGAHLTKTASIPRMGLMIASANVSVDLLAGLAIFPIVFAYGLKTTAGPGLIFETLPIAFGQMPGGRFFGTLFFILVFFAALSTSISMLNSVVSRLIELKGSRTKMTLLAGGLAWIIGLASVFSFNIWSDFKPLSFIPRLREATIFRIIDFFTVNVLVMVSAFLIFIFVGWIMSEQSTQDELAIGNGFVYRAWRFVMRYLAPIAIAIIFVIGFVN